jgi:hypothetical protein
MKETTKAKVFIFKILKKKKKKKKLILDWLLLENNLVGKRLVGEFS